MNAAIRFTHYWLGLGTPKELEMQTLRSPTSVYDLSKQGRIEQAEAKRARKSAKRLSDLAKKELAMAQSVFRRNELRRDALRDLVQELETALDHTLDNERFSRLVNEGLDKLRMSEHDLAERFSISRPSVSRWRNGVSSPHPAMRTPVYRELGNLVRTELAKLNRKMVKKNP